MDLEILIRKCCRQNLKAQSEIYGLFADKLFKVCLKYSKNHQDAQDTLQDSFLMIFKDMKKFKNKGSFEGWLKRVTINVALQKFRSKSVLKLSDHVDYKILEKPEDINIDESKIDLNLILSLVRKLPERYQLVFNLQVLDGYSHKEIAKLLNISIGTSKSNLSRARVILQQEINFISKMEHYEI
ncbi:MAG: RNA polymerase sigma factor (sigma-70 family) [Polaribacter sp.]